LRNKLVNISLLVLSIIISLLLCEGILRIFSGNEYYIWLPNLKYVFLPDPKIFPGIKDTSYLEINALGLRGSNEEITDATNILVLGGSATECLYLDQKETWPALIEQYLNEGSNKKYNVFNGGRSGITSQHHLAQVQKLLERNQWIDVIIIMEGLNDLQYALSFKEGYKQKDSQLVYEESFWLSPLKEIKPFYRNTYLFKYLSKVKKAIFSHKLTQDPYGNTYVKWRSNRANAKEIINAEPNLTQSLVDYQRNNQAMIDFAKSRNKRIIFIPQPVAWDTIMEPGFSKLCWYGWIGQSQYENTGKYYAFTQLKKSLDIYNELLKNTCLKNNVECIELEGRLEKDTSTFYDDCHFNENGARKAAKIVADYLFTNVEN
jgi:lysophospholipase L1-like esterase